MQHEAQVAARGRVVLIRPEQMRELVAAHPVLPRREIGKQLIASLGPEFNVLPTSLGDRRAQQSKSEGRHPRLRTFASGVSSRPDGVAAYRNWVNPLNVNSRRLRRVDCK